MKRVMWGVAALLVAMSAGCPDASRDCRPGSYYNETLRACLVDCRDLSNPGCRDSGIGADVTDAADAAPQCTGAQIACEGRCVDPATDSNHCGRCGVRCASSDGGTSTCSAGACQLNCGAATHACNGACVADDSVASCGTRCDPCPVPSGARATCAAGACGVECLPGFERNGMACDVIAPRPVFPPGTSTVTSLRPTLRWSLPAGVDGARIQVCRDRACTMVVATIEAAGASTRPMADLPTSTVLFWRIAGRVGASAGERFSPTWQFRTRAANTPVDTAHGVDLDVNGDGFSDAAIYSRVGRVNIHHGSAAGVSAAASATIASTRIATFLVPTRVVSSAGDIDGDGYADVVVGYPTEVVSGMVGAGCVRWFRGGALGLATTASATFCASEASASIGIAVAGVGDLNGDGYADVAVGASGSTSMAVRTAGSVLVFLGSATGWSASPSRTLSGTLAGENMGSAVSAAVDVNGDQFSDLIVGHGGGGPIGAGIATLWRGSATGIERSASLTAEGVANGDYFGSALAGGDFNGDGFGDVVIGAQAGPTTSVGGNAGSVTVLFGSMSGLQPASPTTLRATQDTSNFGHTIVNAGDTNRDGFDDVLIGAPTARPGGLTNAGSALLFRGASAAMSTSATQTIAGSNMQDNFGIAVGGGGDFNRDGFADVIIGSSNASPTSRPQAGTATIFTGGAAALTPSATLEGAAAMDGFGAGVASWVPRSPRAVYHRRACVALR
jgi:hypothetical protein